MAHFPGLSLPATISSEDLSEQDARKLPELLDAAHFFDLPESIPPPAGAADYNRYILTVDDGTRRHTVNVTDPVDDPNLRSLIEFVRAKSERP